jgi:hypothetical protein
MLIKSRVLGLFEKEIKHALTTVRKNELQVGTNIDTNDSIGTIKVKHFILKNFICWSAQKLAWSLIKYNIK